MKKKVLLLVGLLLIIAAISAAAEGKIELLGGPNMDNAVILSNEQLGQEIVGNYENRGLSASKAQLEGWYGFRISRSGTCVIRVKSYNNLVCHFNLLDSNGQQLEKDFFGGGFGINSWKTYTLNAKEGEMYYLHFTRNSADKQWACMFSVCIDGKHKASASETTIQQATCTQSGTVGYPCELCGEYMISGTIPAKGHQPGIESVLKAANCLQKGEKGILCSVCGEVMSSIEIPMQGHTPGAYVDVQKATCTADGVRAQYCQVCNATLNTEKATAFGHQSGEWRTVAVETCYQAGRREKNCITCGAILAVEEIPQEEHQYSEWKTILEPTKETEGEQGRICVLCGDMQINKIPKIEKFLGIF
ncbi:MAG: hypothetical protein IJ313_03220 [Clostridia bacterium]|nr:hypothetical protein [Clostridia bacterium]